MSLMLSGRELREVLQFLVGSGGGNEETVLVAGREAADDACAGLWWCV